jgi:hypothetical protein
MTPAEFRDARSRVLKMSLKQMGEAMRVHFVTIHRWERSKNKRGVPAWAAFWVNFMIEEKGLEKLRDKKPAEKYYVVEPERTEFF